MARLTAPDEGSRLVYRVVGGSLIPTPGVAAVFYSDVAGTILADIRDSNGLAVASTLTVDSYSRLPIFQMPDGVDTVYVSVSGGPVTPVYARTDDRIDALVAADTAADAAAKSTYRSADVVVRPSGDATGATDSAALAAAVTACPVGGVIFLGRGAFFLNTAWTINKALTVLTEGGVSPLYGSQVTSINTINLPTIAPYLTGTVLTQVTAATNVITLSGAGLSVNFKGGIGLTWAAALRFVNTGHGIYYLPPTVTGGRDNGLSGAAWDPVHVFGHDGNHYAVYLVNPISSAFGPINSYGGGNLYLENNSLQNYGNCVFRQPFGMFFCNGTADGMRLKNTAGRFNLMVFIRPQVYAKNLAADFPASTAPTVAQKLLNSDVTVFNTSWIAVDFETDIIGMGINWPDPATTFVDGAAYFYNLKGNQPRSFVPAGRAKVTRDTSTNKTISATTPTAVNAVTLDITLTDVRPGDTIEVGISALVVPNATQYGFMDAATIPAGTPVTWASSGSGTFATEGVSAWEVVAGSIPTTKSGSTLFVVGVPDINTSGNLAIRLYAWAAAGANTWQLNSNPAEMLTFHAKVVG